jgi:hypothetical protein
LINGLTLESDTQMGFKLLRLTNRHVDICILAPSSRFLGAQSATGCGPPLRPASQTRGRRHHGREHPCKSRLIQRETANRAGSIPGWWAFEAAAWPTCVLTGCGLALTS